MQPIVALTLCLAFVSLALVLDARRSPRPSWAIFIPLAWFCILGSRPIDVWFSSFGSLGVGTESGSALNQLVFGVLMLLAIAVLRARKPPWRQWGRANTWIVVFLCYCGASMVWSDFPGISLRRWIRAAGAVLVIMVILTEDDPREAVATVIRRAGLILLPVSVLLIKYYREFGVTYDYWTGELQVCGVTTDKNALGRLAMFWAVFALWEFIRVAQRKRTFEDMLRTGTNVLVFVTALWLLYVARSSTSLVCFVIGATTVVLLKLRVLSRIHRNLGTFIIVTAAIVLGLNATFNLSDIVLGWLGKDPTLTMRTFLWRDLLDHVSNPLVGVGYDSFWLGSRLQYFIENYRVTSAHNGYLDIYLELGAIGLLIYAMLLHRIFANGKAQLISGESFGQLCIASLLVFLAYNITEAAWRLTHFAFFVLVMVGARLPVVVAGLAERTTQPSRSARRGLRSTRGVTPTTRGSEVQRFARPTPRQRK
jgi:O-antigen ligase